MRVIGPMKIGPIESVQRFADGGCTPQQVGSLAVGSQGGLSGGNLEDGETIVLTPDLVTVIGTKTGTVGDGLVIFSLDVYTVAYAIDFFRGNSATGQVEVRLKSAFDATFSAPGMSFQPTGTANRRCSLSAAGAQYFQTDTEIYLEVTNISGGRITFNDFSFSVTTVACYEPPSS